MNRKKVGNVPTKGFEPGTSCLWSDCAKPCTPKPVNSYIITLLHRKGKSKLCPPKISQSGSQPAIGTRTWLAAYTSVTYSKGSDWWTWSALIWFAIHFLVMHIAKIPQSPVLVGELSVHAPPSSISGCEHEYMEKVALWSYAVFWHEWND